MDYDIIATFYIHLDEPFEDRGYGVTLNVVGSRSVSLTPGAVLGPADGAVINSNSSTAEETMGATTGVVPISVLGGMLNFGYSGGANIKGTAILPASEVAGHRANHVSIGV